MPDLDFNDAGEQGTSDLIPEKTICTVQLNIKPGGAGDDGMLSLSKSGTSEALNCTYTVVDGPHAKRKMFVWHTVKGTDAQANFISDTREKFRAILESVHGIDPADKSEKAEAARRVKGWGDLDGLRFQVRVGIEPPSNGYRARNSIEAVITKRDSEWKEIPQVERTAAPVSNTTAQPAAGAITRPDWAR